MTILQKNKIEYYLNKTAALDLAMDGAPGTNFLHSVAGYVGDKAGYAFRSPLLAANSLFNPLSRGNLGFDAAYGTVQDIYSMLHGGEALQNANSNIAPDTGGNINPLKWKNWGLAGNVGIGAAHPVGAIGGMFTGLANLAGYGNAYKSIDNSANIAQIEARQKSQIAAGQAPHNPLSPSTQQTQRPLLSGGGIASSLNNVKVSNDQTMNKHQIGFIKRAMAYGLNQEEAMQICKEAFGMGEQPNMSQGPNFPKPPGQQVMGPGMQQPPMPSPSPAATPQAPTPPAIQPPQQQINSPIKPQIQLNTGMPNPMQQFNQEQLAGGNINPMQNQMVDKTLSGLTDKSNPERSQEIQTLMSLLRNAQTQTG